MTIGLGNIYRKRPAESRSLTAENFRGEKGRGAMATFETALHEPSARAAVHNDSPSPTVNSTA